MTPGLQLRTALALFPDAHSEEAIARARRPGVHLLSTLVRAEVPAVLARMPRERVLSYDGRLRAAARGEGPA